MSDTPQTSDRCQDCGKEIPALPVKNAFCVACRYHGPKTRPTGGKSEFDIAIEKADENAGAQNPWQSAPTIEADLLNALRDTGATFPDVAGALNAIAIALDVAGDQRAGEAMNLIAAKLERTAAGIALQRVISGDSEPLRQAAERAGCSHVAIFKQEKTIRKRLRVNKRPTCRGKRFAGQKLKAEKL